MSRRRLCTGSRMRRTSKRCWGRERSKMQRGEFPASFRYAGLMYFSFRLGALAILTAALSMTAWAQASRTVNGHWQGALKNQGQDLTVVLDLTKNQKGEW